MSRVSRIQQRFEQNIQENSKRNYNTNRQPQPQQQQPVPSWRQALRQRQEQQSQLPNETTWGDSVRNGFTNFREARPVQGLTTLVTETIPKATNLAWTKCGMDTTWEEFNRGNNPFSKGSADAFWEDFNPTEMIDDDDSIVDRDPFNFPIKPNQPSSRRKEQVEVGWANFHSPHFEVTAVRYNPNHSPPSRAGTATTASASTFKGSSSVDDVFYDHGEKMFADVKAVPITEVFPIDYHHVEQIILQPQMTDPDEASQEGNNDEKGLFGNNKNAATTTKTSRFFGGGFMMKAPPAETKEKVDKQVEKQTKKEVERLRKLEEQRLQEIQEAKEREDERIRRKEALLKREEERLAREQERILQEEERMMREEEERERRREERRLRELEIARLKEERRERELRKRDDLEFGRFEQTRQTKKSDEGGILAWEDVELQDDSFESFEVDWQGFPPPSTATSPRRPPQESRKREPRERAPRPPREPREPIKIECPTCTCPNKKLFAIIICLLLLAGIGVGIYFALDSFGALGGDDDRNPDCSAVMGGFAIPKESMYPTVRLSWVMDISGQSQWTSIPALTSAVRNHFQDTAIPTLAGCLGEQQDNVFGSQYDILNGYVRSVRDVGSCRAGEPQPCARVLVDFVVYVRGQSSVLDLIEHISTRYTNDVTDAMDQMENVRQTGLVGLFEQRS